MGLLPTRCSGIAARSSVPPGHAHYVGRALASDWLESALLFQLDFPLPLYPIESFLLHFFRLKDTFLRASNDASGRRNVTNQTMENFRKSPGRFRLEKKKKRGLLLAFLPLIRPWG